MSPLAGAAAWHRLAGRCSDSAACRARRLSCGFAVPATCLTLFRQRGGMSSWMWQTLHPSPHTPSPLRTLPCHPYAGVSKKRKAKRSQTPQEGEGGGLLQGRASPSPALSPSCLVPLLCSPRVAHPFLARCPGPLLPSSAAKGKPIKKKSLFRGNSNSPVVDGVFPRAALSYTPTFNPPLSIGLDVDAKRLAAGEGGAAVSRKFLHSSTLPKRIPSPRFLPEHGLCLSRPQPAAHTQWLESESPSASSLTSNDSPPKRMALSTPSLAPLPGGLAKGRNPGLHAQAGSLDHLDTAVLRDHEGGPGPTSPTSLAHPRAMKRTESALSLSDSEYTLECSLYSTDPEKRLQRSRSAARGTFKRRGHGPSAGQEQPEWTPDGQWACDSDLPPDPSLEPVSWTHTVDKAVLEKLPKKEIKRQEMIYGAAGRLPSSCYPLVPHSVLLLPIHLANRAHSDGAQLLPPPHDPQDGEHGFCFVSVGGSLARSPNAMCSNTHTHTHLSCIARPSKKPTPSARRTSRPCFPT